MPDITVVSGNSNLPLAKKVSEVMDVVLTKTQIRKFQDGEIWVKYEENIRGDDVFIIQSTNSPLDNLFELLMLIDAAKRASAKRVTAVIPYFGYARQDRKDQPRVSITAKLVSNLITTAGADRVISIDLHSSQIQGFFDIPFDHLYASPVLLKAVRRLGLDNFAVASPDVGGVKTARAYAKHLGCQLVLVDKRRPAPNETEIVHIIGEVEDRNIIIVDDMIDTANTFIQCAEALREKGARDIFGVCVHPVLSGEANLKIDACEAIKLIFVTDTIKLEKKSEKVKIVSIADLLGEAIIRTHDNRSISTLFEIER